MAKITQNIAGSYIVETLKPYEIMLIFQPELLENALEKKLKEFEHFLAENGAKVDVKDIWGKRDLAYTIGRFNRGIYVLYNLHVPNVFLADMDEYLRIDRDLIRHLTLSLKKNYKYEKPTLPEKTFVKPQEKVLKAEEKKPQEKISEKPKKAEEDAKSEKNLDQKLESILNDNELKL